MHTSHLTRRAALAAGSLFLPGCLERKMPTLRVRVIANPIDEIGYGSLELDLRDSSRTPTQFRLARHVNDLPYAHWRQPEADIMEIPWMFSAYQHGGASFICAEIEYDTGENTIVSTTGYMREPFVQRPIRAMTSPDPLFLFRIRPSNDVNSWPMIQYGDTAPARGNNIRPFDVSNGYAWCSENARTVDVGETPEDIILAHVYARHFDPYPNVFEFSPGSTRMVAHLGSQDLRLFGAICVWGVLCVHPDGKRGRYHLMEPLSFGSMAGFAVNDHEFRPQNHPNWRCSFAADNVPFSQMPPGPSNQIEAVELILRLPEKDGSPIDLGDPPTGLIKIKEFAVKQ